MITLGNATSSLQIKLGGAVTTNELPVVVSFFEVTLAGMTAADAEHQCVETNGTTPVTILSSPASGKARKANWMSVPNTDTVAATVTIEFVDSALTPTTYEVYSVVLNVGDMLQFTEARGFEVRNSAGQIKSTTAGTDDHADLTNLSWTASGHVGTATRVPWFDDSNVAALAEITGTGKAVFDTSPTILTPTIADFSNANHDHEDSAGGGQLNASNVFNAGATQLTYGGTGASLSDPGADRILFWDDSESTADWLTVATGVEISGTTLQSVLASTAARGAAAQLNASSVLRPLLYLSGNNLWWPATTYCNIFNDSGEEIEPGYVCRIAEGDTGSYFGTALNAHRVIKPDQDHIDPKELIICLQTIADGQQGIGVYAYSQAVISETFQCAIDTAGISAINVGDQMGTAQDSFLLVRHHRGFKALTSWSTGGDDFVQAAPDGAFDRGGLFWIQNDSASTLPACGVAMITGVIEAYFTVEEPDDNNMAPERLVINLGKDIPAGELGVGTFANRAEALYDSGIGTPGVGDTLGTTSGSFLLSTTKRGFVALGAPLSSITDTAMVAPESNLSTVNGIYAKRIDFLPVCIVASQFGSDTVTVDFDLGTDGGVVFAAGPGGGNPANTLETIAEQFYFDATLNIYRLFLGVQTTITTPPARFVIATANTGTGDGVPYLRIVKDAADSAHNTIEAYIGTTLVWNVTHNGGMVVNENGEDADTRIEGDADINLLMVDASADTVQVGSATTSDSAKFYVNGKIKSAGETQIGGDLNHDGSNAGFFGATPAAQPAALTQTYSTADRTLGAYTADDESGAYTGIDNAQGGTPYAQLIDLNALRTAYENLRAFVEDLAQHHNALVDDLQTLGLEQ